MLDKSYDLFLGYTWGEISQGISGHLYECIEYYHILKNHFKVGIFFCNSEKITKDVIHKVMLEKYDFTEDEMQELLSDVHFFDSPKILNGRNVLFVDGYFPKIKHVHLLFDNIMAFACYNRALLTMDNITGFLDFRVYGECTHHKNYTKKMLFSRYKKVNSVKTGTNLLYNKRQRLITVDAYKEMENRYDGNFLLISDIPVENLSDRFEIHNPPVSNLFEKFDNYIYTPLAKKFDCSPRFISECKWYGKDVHYHNIDYWKEDTGLYWRKHDIENNFESLMLKEDDEIIKLVEDIINV